MAASDAAIAVNAPHAHFVATSLSIRDTRV
jgi:hypothetical protein